MNNVTFDITNWTCLEIAAALKAADLVTTRSDNAVDSIVIANDALKEYRRKKIMEHEDVWK